MTVVLTYQGKQSQRPQAEAKLRQVLGGVKLTPKTSETLECELDVDQLMHVDTDGVWLVTQPVYAELCPPRANLSKLRRKRDAAR